MKLKLKLKLWALIIVFCLVYPEGTPLLHAENGKTFKAKVTRVIDGDSIKVRSGKKNYELRLYGIDAPEYDQPFAAEAKKFLKKRLLGKTVFVDPVEYDRYGRLVAIVHRGDVIINEILLAQGLAWYYPKYCKKRICSSWKKTNKQARKKRKSIWSESSPTAPWTWKYQKHRKQGVSHQT